MRNFSKTLISMAAVMAVGSAMAAGAMAATLSATYSNGTVSIGNVTTGKDQYTLLIVQGEKAEGSSEYSYYAKNTTIKQIDQNDAGVPFTSTTVGTLDEGSYKVLVGNEDGTVDTGYFTVGGTTEPDEPDVPVVEPDTIIIGDVDSAMDGSITSTDVGNILRAANGYGNRIGKCGTVKTIYGTENTIIIGDVDSSTDGAITSTDVGNVLRAANGYSNRIGKCGTSIDVVKE